MAKTLAYLMAQVKTEKRIRRLPDYPMASTVLAPVSPYHHHFAHHEVLQHQVRKGLILSVAPTPRML